MPPMSARTKSVIKMKKMILEISAAADAICVKPSNAAMSAIMRNAMDQRSMVCGFWFILLIKIPCQTKPARKPQRTRRMTWIFFPCSGTNASKKERWRFCPTAFLLTKRALINCSTGRRSSSYCKVFCGRY